MQEHKLMACNHCGKSVADSAGHGMHRRCWAQACAASASRRDEVAMSSADGAPDIDLLPTLPSLDDICFRQVVTKEFLEPEILAAAETEFLRCVSNASQYVDKDAWSHVGTPSDTTWRKRCRVAWTELFMFSKACLPQLPGGKAKAQRNKNIVLSRLARWRSGERKTLWDDIPCRFKAVNLGEASEEQKLKLKQEHCIAYAQNGMPSKAIDRLVGNGLAPDNDSTLRAFKSKFP